MVLGSGWTKGVARRHVLKLSCYATDIGICHNLGGEAGGVRTRQSIISQGRIRETILYPMVSSQSYLIYLQNLTQWIILSQTIFFIWLLWPYTLLVSFPPSGHFFHSSPNSIRVPQGSLLELLIFPSQHPLGHLTSYSFMNLNIIYVMRIPESVSPALPLT